MSIDWTNEAIEATFKELQVDERKDEWESYIRAALDAAVKAQQLFYHPDGIEIAKQQARAEALEEAAAFVEGKGGKIPGASVFASLVSRNSQPCMSGDGRDRLSWDQRQMFDEAMSWLASRIRALKEKQG